MNVLPTTPQAMFSRQGKHAARVAECNSTYGVSAAMQVAPPRGGGLSECAL